MQVLMAVAGAFLTIYTLQALWLLYRSTATPCFSVPRIEQAPTEITVLIPCFNEETVLAATVHSVMRSRGVHILRVICIDDGSQDHTANVIQDMQQRYGSVIQGLEQPNGGKASALNHGLCHVRTAACACIDADTQVLPDTLAALARVFAEPGVVAVAGHLAVGDGPYRERTLHLGQQIEYAGANTARRALGSLSMTLVVPGSVGLFSASAIRAIGGYSGQTLAEDHDLTMTLALAGEKVRYTAHAWALTETPDDLRSLYRQRLRWATGKFQVWLKHRSVIWGDTPGAPAPWLFMLVHELLAPLACLPALLLLSFLAGLSTWRGDTATWPGLCAMAILANVIAGWVYHRASWRRECSHRACLGLKVQRSGFGAVMLINLIGCATAWHGLFRVMGRRKAEWGSVHRHGSVRLPRRLTTSQHPADISDTKQ